MYARDIILDLLNSPISHQLHIKRFVCHACHVQHYSHISSVHSFAASVILHVVYGKTTPTLLSDPFLLQLQKMIPRVQSAMMPGTYLVDKYPILKYVPGYGRNLRAWRREEYQMLSGQLNWVKSQVVRTAQLFIWTNLDMT